MTLDIEAFLATCRKRTNLLLENCLPSNDAEPGLIEAIRYATLGKAKRIRPCLVYAGAALASNSSSPLGTPYTDLTHSNAIDNTACAIELIHTYSLIHDDLPAMDDDDLRRGKATCHIAYDEATAILAGDALQSLAFEQLSLIDDIPPAQVLLLVQHLSQASGMKGMVLGQAMDLGATNKSVDVTYLETMHRHKTADLIAASVVMGALSNGHADERILLSLHDYGMSIGLAFQVRDDILDELGDTETLGKTVGADAARHKNTYTSLLGIERSKTLLDELLKHSLSALDGFGDRATQLRDLAHFMVQRTF
ncbi:MAG: polyprenyl synthetase family protein [Porticoccaceae bacterium]|nr:polyprenyl synthetase family protein [Porticoccaceae bacterium]